MSKALGWLYSSSSIDKSLLKKILDKRLLPKNRHLGPFIYIKYIGIEYEWIIIEVKGKWYDVVM